MIHSVEKLILVDEASDDEVYQSKEKNEPRARQDAVDDANDEDEDGLRKVEAIAEDRWLHQFGVVLMTDN